MTTASTLPIAAEDGVTTGIWSPSAFAFTGEATTGEADDLETMAVWTSPVATTGATETGLDATWVVAVDIWASLTGGETDTGAWWFKGISWGNSLIDAFSTCCRANLKQNLQKEKKVKWRKSLKWDNL